MTMRVTNRMMVQSSVRRMTERLAAFERTQKTLATGKRIHTASDDVAGMNRALSVRAGLAANAQAKRNAEDGAMWVELADTRLASVVDGLQRVRELAVTARNATANGEQLDAIANEVAELKEVFLSAANSRHRGRPLFAGFSGSDAVASVGGVWTYQGDDGAITRRISDSDVVTINVTADDVFGFTDGEDLFTVLDDFEARLRSGDQSGVGASIDALDRAMGRVLEARSRLGAAGSRIESARFRADAEEVQLRTQLSAVEDVDIAEAVMELQMQEVSYQAAQGALAKALQPSLAAFLR